MSLGFLALCFAANNPLRLAEFWGHVLGREVVDDGHNWIALPASDAAGLPIRFHPTLVANPDRHRMHFDLTSTSLEDQQQTVARALQLGARHLDIGQGPDVEHVVLADPEGNEFCVIEPGNTFLAGCGFMGAVNCEGTQDVGYFWSEALGWPLVWDRDQETAIQSPRGGPKVTWSGPPVAPKTGRNRLHFDVAAVGSADPEAEIARLISLGASRLETDRAGVGRVLIADPDGNEFCVLTTQ
jgi:catechol 2,3-dioxygenase-like lactoylglutathione lyase family enzyme